MTAWSERAGITTANKAALRGGPGVRRTLEFINENGRGSGVRLRKSPKQKR
jgi:hypothetical protein